MATTGIHTGHVMRIYVDSVAVANATNCTLDLTMSPRTIAHKDTSGTGGGWEEKLAGKKSGSLQSDFLREEGDSWSALFTAFAAGTQIAFKYSTEVMGDKFMSGNAFIVGLSQAAPDEENATGSVSLDIDGAVTEGTVA